ncbi:MAG: glycosyltransferase [Chitinivibrionales bacterium]|nr:glycosyltransferase [Chitinivibrionales bacterium]MBD3394952.1 glycosyltransferase [Chitinivibrionales bacterium]
MLFETHPPRSIDAASKQAIRGHYDRVAAARGRFRARHWYYHRQIIRYLRFVIPRGSRVLDIGCGDGALLRALHPRTGVGIDFSEGMIAAARNQWAAKADPGISLEFHAADIEATTFNETFDFVILSDVLGNLLDIQQALDNVRTACSDETRIVINYHSILWEPLLKLGESLSYKMPQPHHNWLSPADIRNFLTLSDMELVRHERKLLFPLHVPLLSFALNRFIAPLPLINTLCLSHFIIARNRPRPAPRDHSVTIVIPCRNERGNVRPALDRLPQFGTRQQIIFVDGRSTDGTPEEVRRAIEDRRDRDIRLLVQNGTGKGDAVRLGFANATGDILMILDADLTVPPEDLPRFYEALAAGKGDFINGSRLVYAMEKQAMRFLNTLGNALFSALFSWLLSQKLKDTLCGTKVLFKKDYLEIERQRSYFGDFDPFGDFDLLFGAAKLNLKILELPIRYRDRTYGTTNIHRIRHGLLLLRMSVTALRKFKA